jgi:ureidoacrylate peracid hydrolase
MSTKALILVDLENEWIDKSSSYYVGDISAVISRTNKLIDRCRANDYKIVFIAHMETKTSGAFAEDSENTRIISSLHKKDSDVLIKKNKISPFYKTNLDRELKGIKELVVCGVLTNLCVRSLVQDAYDRDFKITVIKDCCVAFDKETQEFTFKDLKETREEIQFIDLDKFV